MISQTPRFGIILKKFLALPGSAVTSQSGRGSGLHTNRARTHSEKEISGCEHQWRAWRGKGHVDGWDDRSEQMRFMKGQLLGGNKKSRKGKIYFSFSIALTVTALYQIKDPYFLSPSRQLSA